MPADEFARLAEAAISRVPDVTEFTIEVNPDDVTEQKALLWRDCGVNRVSMGVQSLCDEELQFIGRRHTAVQAVAAANILRERFENISLDLMFGLPGQSLESFRDSVKGVVALNPDHISAYSLMYEERTAITTLRDSGRLEEADENLSVEMYRMLRGLLMDAGFEQYELSNYARPGRRSLHNSMYWLGLPYIGIGPAAHSYDGLRTRRANLPDIRRYMADPLTNFEEEKLSDDELREEMIMTRLRTREGLSLSEFSQRFGVAAEKNLLAAAADSIPAGDLQLSNGSISLTESGVMISDEIISSLF
jgi:oxygen-independent coproporphyrinogen-3 oxidase